MASFYGGEKGQSFKAHIYRGPNTLEDAKILEGEFLVIGDGIVSQEDVEINAEKDYRGSFWIKKFTTEQITNSEKTLGNFVSDDSNSTKFELVNTVTAGFYYELFTWIHGQPASIDIAKNVNEGDTANFSEFKLTKASDSTAAEVKFNLTRPRNIQINYPDESEDNEVDVAELNPIQSPTATVAINDNGDLEFAFGIPGAATFTQLDLSEDREDEDGNKIEAEFNTPAQGFTAKLESTEIGDYILETTKARPIKVAEDENGKKIITSSNTLDTAKSTPTIDIDTDTSGDLKFEFNFPRPIQVADVKTYNDLNPKDDQSVEISTNNDTGDLKFDFYMRKPIEIAKDTDGNKLITSSNTLDTAKSIPTVDIDTDKETGNLTFEFNFPRPIAIKYPKDEELGEYEVGVNPLNPGENPKAEVQLNDNGDLEFSFSLPNAATFTQRDLSQGENAQFNTPAVGFIANLQPELDEQNQETGNYILETTKARGIQIANQKNEDGTNKIDDNGNTIPDITVTNNLNPNAVPEINVNTNGDGDLTFNFNMPRPITVEQSAVFTRPINPNQNPSVTADTNDEAGDLTFNFDLPRAARFKTFYQVIGSSVEPRVYSYQVQVTESAEGEQQKQYVRTIKYNSSIQDFIAETETVIINNETDINEGDYVLEFYIPLSAFVLKAGDNIKVATTTVTPDVDPQIIAVTPDSGETNQYGFTFQLPRAARFKIGKVNIIDNPFSLPQYYISRIIDITEESKYKCENGKYYDKTAEDIYEEGDYIIEIYLPSGNIFDSAVKVNQISLSNNELPSATIGKNTNENKYQLTLNIPKPYDIDSVNITQKPHGEELDEPELIFNTETNTYSLNFDIEQGAPAGFGTATGQATRLDYGQDPTINIEVSGEDTAKEFAFNFGIPEGKPFEFSGTYTWDEANNLETELIQNTYILINIENNENGHDNGLYVYKVNDDIMLEYVGPFASGDTIKGAYKIPFGEIYKEENENTPWFDLIKRKPDNAWYCLKNGYEYPLNYIKDNEIGFGLIVPEENNEVNGKFNYLILTDKGLKINCLNEPIDFDTYEINVSEGNIYFGNYNYTAIIDSNNKYYIYEHFYEDEGLEAFGCKRVFGPKDTKKELNAYTEAGYSYAWEEKSDINLGFDMLVKGEKECSIAIAAENEPQAKASALGAIALGGESTASGAWSTTFGQNTEARGRASMAGGVGSITHELSTMAVGSRNNAFGLESQALGADTKAWARQGHAEGYKTEAGSKEEYELDKGKESGFSSDVIACHAEGDQTKAIGTKSHAEGSETQALGGVSHAEGKKTIAYAQYSHTEGYGTYTGFQGFYDESGNLTQGPTPIAKPTDAQGAHAEGFCTFAWNNGSHAEGKRTISTGNGSHAEGNLTQAHETGSHAEGHGTIAYGAAHAEGYNTIAGGKDNYMLSRGTHAEGIGTQALSVAMHAQGKYNKTTSGVAHVVGWGDKEGQEKDIHILGTNGAAWFAGEVRVGQQPKRLIKEDDIASTEKLGLVRTEENGTISTDENGILTINFDSTRLINGLTNIVTDIIGNYSFVEDEEGVEF